jgi:outer membrane protein assembly factor BamB
MSIAQTDEPTLRKPLRLWPGVATGALLVLAGLGVPLVMPDNGMDGVLVAVVCGLLIVLWWLFFSRAPWRERLGTIVLMIAMLLATRLVVHPSISNAGMGRMMYIFSLPVLALALVCWAVAARRLSGGLRWASLAGAILLACGVIALVRTSGVSGDGMLDLRWRWTPTPEERLLAQAAEEPTVPPSFAPAAKVEPAKPAPAPAPSAPSETPAPTAAKAASEPPPPKEEPRAIWPGFRGPNRDGVIRGVQIETDWSKSPPVELWRRPVGPGWSSFAVRGDLVYTQEQRGAEEHVSCYNLRTGKLVWRHRDAARFWEANAGPGPRGTPTVSNGRIYTLGATGIVNALDADTGAVVWSRNAASDTGAPTPGWGFTSSPLVVDDLVIVAASGRLAAYDVATGNPRWQLKTGGGSYSSPQLMTIGGITQVVMLSSVGATSVTPADGKRLWDYAWEGTTILQPGRTPDGDVLISTGDMMGGVATRRIAVARGPSGWKAEDRWTSRGLKPYFNDIVVHNGHAFGFDGSILSCIDLADGTRKWKGGRYGHGQLVLLPEQDLLLVLSEEGELALVRAAPGQFTEVARFKAIEGKTWNHPVLAGDVLLVRNGEEMAAFRLTHAGS